MSDCLSALVSLKKKHSVSPNFLRSYVFEISHLGTFWKVFLTLQTPVNPIS
jgi:hypothetical protein